MRLPFLLILFPLISLRFAGADDFSSAADSSVSGSAIIHEINLARKNPALYASYLEELRSRYDGNFLVLGGMPGSTGKKGLEAWRKPFDSFILRDHYNLSSYRPGCAKGRPTIAPIRRPAGAGTEGVTEVAPRAE